jgi:hypothetical protein
LGEEEEKGHSAVAGDTLSRRKLMDREDAERVAAAAESSNRMMTGNAG